MHSVFLLPDDSMVEAVARIDAWAQCYAGRSWIWRDAFWIELEDPADWSDGHNWEFLRSKVDGALPSSMLRADVNGRRTAAPEIVELVEVVLRHGGRVADDQNEVVWTAADVTQGRITYGFAGLVASPPVAPEADE